MKNRNSRFPAILFMLAFFYAAATPKAFGVAPAPDGGYPGGNTAEGTSALLSRTTGLYNSAFGIYSLLSITNGNFCTGVGAGTLLLNTADQNTANGAGALLSNTTGTFNTANGTFALFLNTEGDSNTATGRGALQSNTTGNSNTANGDLALFNNTATGNTAVGASALLSNTTGGTLGNIAGFDVGPNVAIGWQALESNTVASANTAVGYQALQSFTAGPVGFEQLGLCTAVGFQALTNNAAGGTNNSGFGYQALLNNTTGFTNSAFGSEALLSNTEGNSNIAIGSNALHENTIGFSNTAVGGSALVSNISGSDNTALGVQAGAGVTTASNVICIGNTGQNFSDTTWIKNVYGVTTVDGTTLPVIVSETGQLGTAPSSARFKKDIKPMDSASEAILALKPVTFHYKSDAKGTPQFGLIAEEVAEVNPDLVVRDKKGEILTVRYDQVNAMLLNEFIKEHRKVGDLEATVAQQQKSFQSQLAKQEKQMEALALGLQKVSAQFATANPSAGGLEVNRLRPQVVSIKRD